MNFDIKKNINLLILLRNFFLVSLVILLLKIFLIENLPFFDIKFLFIFFLISGFGYFELVFRKNEKQREIYKNVVEFIFFILTIIYISNFNSLEKVIDSFKFYFTSTIIITGFIALLKNRKNLVISKQKEFKKNKKLKIFSLFLIFIIFIIFIFLRLQFLDNTVIESPNHDKFRSYLPNVMNAYEHKNPLFNQNYYYQSLNKYDGKSHVYYDFPFYTWALFNFVFLTKYIPFLLLVRLFLIFLDVIFLLLIYLYFKKVFGNIIAILGLSFLSVNSFFHNYFFVTLMDKPAVIFFFLGLLLYNRNKQLISYLFWGLSVLMKPSFLVIILTYFFTLILLEDIAIRDKINKSINFLILLFIPYISFNLSLKYIPTYHVIIGTLVLILNIFLVYIVYAFLKRKDSSKDLISRLLKNKRVLISLSIFFLSIIFILYNKFLLVSKNYLVDMNIIFKWEMYYLILRQFENYFPKIIWLYLILGLISLILLRDKYKYSIPFSASVFSYFIITSKPIFFHHYYRHILIIFFVFILCMLIKNIWSIQKNKYLKIFLILLISALFINSSYSITNNKAMSTSNSDQSIGYPEAIKYLKDNLNNNEKILSNDYAIQTGIILLSFKPIALFDNVLIREEIKNNGFSETIKKYDVKYYISKGESNFEDTLYFFEDIRTYEELSRTEHILIRISDEYRQKYPDYLFKDLRKEVSSENEVKMDTVKLLKMYNPSQYFRLKKIIGDFYIYEIV